MAFFLDLEKKGKSMSRIIEADIKGAWGTQSWNIPYIIYKKEPVPSVWVGSMVGCPLKLSITNKIQGRQRRRVKPFKIKKEEKVGLNPSSLTR
jgi:hypothetical protein